MSHLSPQPPPSDAYVERYSRNDVGKNFTDAEVSRANPGCGSPPDCMTPFSEYSDDYTTMTEADFDGNDAVGGGCGGGAADLEERLASLESFAFSAADDWRSTFTCSDDDRSSVATLENNEAAIIRFAAGSDEIGNESPKSAAGWMESRLFRKRIDEQHIDSIAADDSNDDRHNEDRHSSLNQTNNSIRGNLKHGNYGGTKNDGHLPRSQSDVPRSLLDNRSKNPPQSEVENVVDEEFAFLHTIPVRRSTSLKTCKTPESGGSAKKAVRFADALGLDLETVRHFLNSNELPVVPKSALRDLNVDFDCDDDDDDLMAAVPFVEVRHLRLRFSEPSSSPDFLRRIQQRKVALEYCSANEDEMTVSGTIRCANISFRKQVLVRYSTNRWFTFEDQPASYLMNSSDGITDVFSFSVRLPPYFAAGDRLEFSVRFSAEGETYWDSNFNNNYCVDCCNT